MYSPPPSQTLERAGVSDAPFAWIEAKHHLAERNEVEGAFLGWADRESAQGTAPSPRVTASRARRAMLSKSRAAIIDGATIQLPPTAATEGRLR